MRIIYLFVALLIGRTACGQMTGTFVITGKIVDGANNPIANVSVKIKGKSAGTSTNSDGFYRLEGAGRADSVIFSHIAYEKVAIFIKGSTLINVVISKKMLSIPEFEVIDSAEGGEQHIKKNETGKTLKIFEKVEINAGYKGGWKALHRYLAGVIQYPASLKKEHIEGEVLIGFTIGTSGEIKDVKVVRGLAPECDQAAVDAVQNMPNWIPAIQNGRAVDFYVELPIRFTLKKKGRGMGTFI